MIPDSILALNSIDPALALNSAAAYLEGGKAAQKAARAIRNKAALRSIQGASAFEIDDMIDAAHALNLRGADGRRAA